MYLLQVNVIWLQELPLFFSSPRQISLNVTLSAQGAKGRRRKMSLAINMHSVPIEAA